MTHMPARRTSISTGVFSLAAAVLTALTPIHETRGQSRESWPPLTVAFIADQGLGAGARAVLRLILEEGADLVLHQGDLDYRDDPSAWDAFIADVLGADFPYFVSIGNNDVRRWYGPDGYQAKLQARLDRVPEATCTGDLGVRSACTFRGLFFILSGIGTEPDEPDDAYHVAYIRDQLAQSDARWKICSWHKNQSAMQVGNKDDEVGWAAYEACREQGAIVATAHTHNYSRSHLMDDFEEQSIASTSSTLVIERGKSFVFVSGLGGQADKHQPPWWGPIDPLVRGLKSWVSSPREQEPIQVLPSDHAAWWSSVHEDKFGALFCTFFSGGEPDHADCYFKDIRGNVPDRFELVSEVEPVSRSAQSRQG
jgi:hypothetical protein